MNTQTNTAMGQALEAAKPKAKANKDVSFKSAMAAVTKALQGVKATLQSIRQQEPLLNTAALACLDHAIAHKNATPADTLVKGLIAEKHPAATQFKDELVAWFRVNSPIRWDAKSKVYLAKEGEPGFHPFNKEEAEKTAFYERPQAKRAREDASRAHANAMKPITFDNAVARILGLRKWAKSALEVQEGQDQARGIAPGQKTKIFGLCAAIEAALADYTGDASLVPASSVAPGKDRKSAKGKAKGRETAPKGRKAPSATGAGDVVVTH